MRAEKFREHIRNQEHPKTVNFWFVRHSESEANTLGDQSPVMHDTPLTPNGEKEAHQIARYMMDEGVHVSHIYSSSAARSTETAEIIGQALGVSVQVRDGLNERNWGNLKSMSWKDLSQRLGGMSLDERYKFVPEAGESWEQMEDRLFTELEKIAEETKSGDDVLIVTHRGALRAVLPPLARAGHEKHEEYSVPLGSLSKFSFEKDEFDFVGLAP